MGEVRTVLSQHKVGNQYFVQLIGKVAVFVCTVGSLQH
jgi:hypothetical protein